MHCTRWRAMSDLSSAHVLFHDEADARALQRAGWLSTPQRAVPLDSASQLGAPRDFGEFLARMQHDKRKKINQQRRKVADAGVVFTVHEGAAIDDALWDFFHRCYTSTYQDHGSDALSDARVLRSDGAVDGRTLGDVRCAHGWRAASRCR